MQQTQLADKLPSEFEPLDWELGQDRNVTSPWILTIISGPRLPPDLHDTVSVWPPCILGNSGSSLERDIIWMKLMNWFVWISIIWILIFHWMRLSWDSCQLLCAIFLVVCRHPLDPSLLIQHATFNKRTRILIFHLQQLVGCKTFLWLVHCALTDSNGGSPWALHLRDIFWTHHTGTGTYISHDGSIQLIIIPI